jgi:hypothetical protein
MVPWLRTKDGHYGFFCVAQSCCKDKASSISIRCLSFPKRVSTLASSGSLPEIPIPFLVAASATRPVKNPVRSTP